MKLTKGRLSKLYSKHKQTKRRFKVNRKRRGPQNTFRKRKPFNLDRKTLKKIRGGQVSGQDKDSMGTTQEKTGNDSEAVSASDNNPTESNTTTESGTKTDVSMGTAKTTAENETEVASSRIDRLNQEGEILGNEKDLRNIISAIKGDGTDDSILELINADADIDLNPEVDGTTVLIAAARAGRQAVVDAILAKDGFNGINTKNNDGETALMVAVEGGHTNIVNNLLQAKPKPADVNITDNNNKTALQIAQGLTDSEEKTNIIAAINEASSPDIPIAEARAVDGKDTTDMPIAEATSVNSKDTNAAESAPPATSNTTDTATGPATTTSGSAAAATTTETTASGPAAAATTETTATGSAAAIENYRQAALALQVAQDALYAAMTKSGNDMNPSSLEATTIAADKIASASDN